MKLYKAMKRGGPKELAPLLDTDWTSDYSTEGGAIQGMSLTFARSEESPFYEGVRLTNVFELRFESLEDFEVMRAAIDAMKARWEGGWSPDEGKGRAS